MVHVIRRVRKYFRKKIYAFHALNHQIIEKKLRCHAYSQTDRQTNTNTQWKVVQYSVWAESAKSESLLNRTATTLEAFEQHLMSYRGIHKHCDTCTQILEQGQVGWFSVPWHILAWIRRRISWGRKSRAEGSLRPSLPRSLLHLLIVGQRSSTKMRSLGSTTSTSGKASIKKKRFLSGIARIT